MKLNAKISWLMGTVQQSLFPYLDESLPDPLTEPEKRLVKILELIQIEQHVPVSRRRQWLGRPIKEREAIARAFVAKRFAEHPESTDHLWIKQTAGSSLGIDLFTGLCRVCQGRFGHCRPQFTGQRTPRNGVDWAHQPGFDGSFRSRETCKKD
jgi:hypothetical protein